MAWLSGWSYRKSLPIPSSGWSLSGDVTDFTIEIPVTSAITAFWAAVKSDGGDVRFTQSDGTTLLKKVTVKFDSTGDSALYLVKIPTLAAASDPTIYLYAGNASATTDDDNTNAFNSTVRAWFALDQNYSGGAFIDLKNGLSGTNSGTTDVADQLSPGRGRAINCTVPNDISVSDNDLLSFGDGSTDTDMSIVSRVKMTDATRFRILTKGNTATGNDYEYLFLLSGADTLQFKAIDKSTAGHKTCTSTGTFTADEGSWIRLAATKTSAGTIALYRNASSVTSTDGSSGSYTAMENLAAPLYIGSYFHAADTTGSGDVGELILLAEVISTDWMKCYEYSSSGSWISWGADESAFNIAIPVATFNFTGQVPTVLNRIRTTVDIPKVDFNFTGKVPVVSTTAPTYIPVPAATFNFSRYAPTIRTTDIGIAVPKVNFNFTGQAPTISVTGNSIIAVPKVNFNFTGYAPSIQLTNTEEEINWGLFDTDGNPITGAAPIIKIRSRSTGYILDWSDETFKAGGGSSPSATMQEMDATNFQGYYRKIFTVTSWADGWYVAATTYSSGTPKQNGSIEFKVQDGQIVDDYNSTNLDMALSAVNSNVSLRLPTSSYTAPDNAGIASTLAEAQSHPTLAEMLAGGVAKESTLTAMQGDIDFLLAVIRNKRYLEKVGSTWYLVIRNDGDTTDILRKALKGTNGTTEITDIQAAALGMEMKSSV